MSYFLEFKIHKNVKCRQMILGSKKNMGIPVSKTTLEDMSFGTRIEELTELFSVMSLLQSKHFLVNKVKK
jgi:hypothetical protein